MADERSPDVWTLIFEQTPAILRWVMGILTLGMFTLASFVYKIHRDNIEKVRLQQKQDMDETRRIINRVHQRIDELQKEMHQGHQVLFQAMTEAARGGRE